MGKYLKKMLNKLVKKEPSPVKLAWSMAIGIYLAFSPFLGVQTFLVFILAFLLSANSAVIFIVLFTINNPWTMLPIAAMDYVFGHWLTETVLELNLMQYDPVWMAWINEKIGSYLTAYLGIEQLCFWCYFVGGNVIAIICSIVTYPFLKKLCTQVVKKYS